MEMNLHKYTAQSVLDRMEMLENLTSNYEDLWKEIKSQFEVLASEDAVEQSVHADGAYCTCSITWSDATSICWRCGKPQSPRR